MPVSEIAEVEVMADSRSRGYGSGQHHAFSPTVALQWDLGHCS